MQILHPVFQFLSVTDRTRSSFVITCSARRLVQAQPERQTNSSRVSSTALTVRSARRPLCVLIGLPRGDMQDHVMTSSGAHLQPIIRTEARCITLLPGFFLADLLCSVFQLRPPLWCRTIFPRPVFVQETLCQWRTLFPVSKSQGVHKHFLGRPTNHISLQPCLLIFSAIAIRRRWISSTARDFIFCF